MVILRWQHLAAARDVMTDDLQEKCMSKTRMSCHFIVQNAQCLHLNLTDCFSLIGAASLCCSSTHSCCCAHRSALPLPFSSNALFHSVAPSFFTCTTERARQSFALAHFPSFICSLLPGCSRQLPFSHPHLSSSSLPQQRPPPVTALHCTKALTTLSSICSDTCHHSTALQPSHCSAFSPKTH